MACCDYPGCGKNIYVYNKERNITIKQKAHTVPTNQKQRIVEILKLGPEKARKVQLILCHSHFRHDAYSETNSARLRRDVPFADLVIVPGSGQTPSKTRRNNNSNHPQPIAAKIPRISNDLFNRTIGAPPRPKEEPDAASTSMVEYAEPVKPVQEFRSHPHVPPVMNGIKNGVLANNENKSKLEFDMKKFRIEVTMKHLLKEKELESRLKASEGEAREYKLKLDDAQIELAQKKEEIQLLKGEAEELKRELSTLKLKLEDETHQRMELEKKNSMLKGDLQITCDLYKADQGRAKRVKLEKGPEFEEPTPSKSDSVIQARLRDLEEQLRASNELREAELNAKEKELANMKKEIKDLHMENQQLYDANIALDMDIRAYRKLVQLEEQRTMVCVKKRRTNDDMLDDNKAEPAIPMVSPTKQTATA